MFDDLLLLKINEITALKSMT